jgi:hypothetical protein
MATSAPIEGQFSIFSNIITKNRNSLDEELARKTILLKSWGIPEIITEELSDNNSDTEEIIPVED